MDIFEGLNIVAKKLFQKNTPLFSLPQHTHKHIFGLSSRPAGAMEKWVVELLSVDDAENFIKNPNPYGGSFLYREARIFRYENEAWRPSDSILIQEYSREYPIDFLKKLIDIQKVRNVFKRAVLTGKIKLSVLFKSELLPLVGVLWSNQEHWMYLLATGEFKGKIGEINKGDWVIGPVIVDDQTLTSYVNALACLTDSIKEKVSKEDQSKFFGKILGKEAENNVFLQAIAYCFQELSQVDIKGNRGALDTKVEKIAKNKLNVTFSENKKTSILNVLRNRHK